MTIRGYQLSLHRYSWTHKLPFFYGWVIVFLGAFSMFYTTPGQSDSFSFFMNSFVKEFGWSRTFVSSLYSGATLLSGCLMFFVGRLVDRIGSKWVAILAAILLGIACMLTSYAMSPVMLFLGFFLARFAGKGALDLSASTLAPQWFITRRALAIMLVGLGGTAGGVLFPLLNSYLITTFGWRAAFRVLAGGLWLIYVPITLIFLISRPEDVGMSPDNTSRPRDDTSSATYAHEEPSFQRSQAIRTSAFWIIALCIFQSSLVGTGVVLHFVSIFEAQGFSMSFAAQIMGIKTLDRLDHNRPCGSHPRQNRPLSLCSGCRLSATSCRIHAACFFRECPHGLPVCPCWRYIRRPDSHLYRSANTEPVRQAVFGRDSRGLDRNKCHRFCHRPCSVRGGV